MSEQENENKNMKNPIEATPVVEPIEKDDNKSSKQHADCNVAGPIIDPTRSNAAKKLKSFLNKGRKG